MKKKLKIFLFGTAIIFSLLFVFVPGGDPSSNFMFLLFFIVIPIFILFGIYMILSRWFEKHDEVIFYTIKEKTIIEFVGITFLQFAPYLFVVPILFLLKSSKPSAQRVAIPPANLRAAKIFMILSLGYWWYYLRYFAKSCPQCNCVWHKELVNSDFLDRKQELYTYKDTAQTEHFDRDMRRTGYSKTTVDKIGVKTLTTAENTYQCANCGHSEVLVETSQT
jgi:hypothetical protein